MFKEKTVTLNKGTIIKSSEMLGIYPNELSKYLNFPIDGEPGDIAEDEKIYDCLLQPQNLTFFRMFYHDTSMLFATTIATREGFALYGSIDELATIKPVTGVELDDFLVDFMGLSQVVETKTKMTLSRDEFFTILAICDCMNRFFYESMVIHQMEELVLTVDSFSEEYAIASEVNDLRWKLPIFSELFDIDEEPDFNSGLKQMKKKNLISFTDDGIELTKEGYELVEYVKDATLTCGSDSFFYSEDQIQHIQYVFMSFGNQLWLMEMGESVNIGSISGEKAREILQMIVSPGEEVPTIIPNSIVIDINEGEEVNLEIAQEESETMKIIKEETAVDDVSIIKESWKCTCGTDNSGNFCKKCGSKKPITKEPSFCKYCGEPRKSKAKFCHKCGQKF